MKRSKKFFAFMTALSISATTFTGLASTALAEGNGISYSDGKITVTYNAEKEAQVIVAHYDGDMLKSIDQPENIQLVNGTSEALNKTLTDGDVVMVWDSLAGANPLVDKYTYYAGGTPTSTPTTTPTEEPGEDLSNIKPVAATYVDYSNPTVSYGDATTLKTGYNKISGGNVGFANTGWGVNYAALIKFDVSSYIQANESVTSAVLTYDATADAARGRNHIVGSTTIENWDNTATYESIGNNIPFTQIGDAHPIDRGTTVTITQDITDYAKSQTDNVYALCVIDTAAGGSDIDKNSIKLELEVMDLSKQIKVSYVVDGVQTDEIISKGESPANVPTPAKEGFIFKGWKIGDTDKVKTSDEVKAMTFDENTTLTAVFEVDSSYVQTIANVEFVDSTGATVDPVTVKAFNYPTEDGAVEYKQYEVKVTSNIGADITDDCTFTWEMVGGGDDDGYCTFISADSDDPDDAAAATGLKDSQKKLKLRQGGSTWLGYIKATAVYNPENAAGPSTKVAQLPCAVVTNSKSDTQILPAAGYPISMDDYDASLIGYKATSDDYSKGYDPVLNNWCIVGSNPQRDFELVEVAGKKALKFTNVGGDRGGSGSSTVGTAAFPAQTQQYVFETIVNFEGTSRIGVWDKTPNNGGAAAEWSVSYSSGVLTAGDQSIQGVQAGTWYKLVVTSDPVNHLYSVYVYDETGSSLVGSVTDITGGTATPKFLCIDGGFPIYLNSVRAYIPAIDSIVINSDTDAIQVPEAGAAANEVSLSAICKTADGIKLTGAVDWSLDQEYQGIELVKGTQTATLKVSNGAAGTVKVIASMGGKTAEKEITLVNSSNVVSFQRQQSSITIPFEGEEAVTAEYEADTITPDTPGGIDDATITYSFLDKTGAVALDELPTGITSSEEGGVLTLTVAAGATPTVFYIKAANSEGLSTKTQVNVHGLSYQFGTETEEGYTAVTSATLYNDNLGYGFESTSGLSDAADSVTGTSAYKFKAKVPNGNYKITVDTTSANMFSEIVDEAVAAGAIVTGITKTGSSFDVAVCDGVLDLTFNAASSVSSLSIAQAPEKTERDKPAVFAIGDSTTSNNDSGNISWGNRVGSGSILPDVFSGFNNHGMAGRDSVNYYNQGRVEAVLLNVCPGDYVTVNMGINSRPENGNEGAAYPILMDTYYVKAIMDRGAIPVILTATPLGYNPGKGWTESNGKIDCDRGTGARNGELRKLAKKYDLNILELGYYFEDYFNNLTEGDLTAYNQEYGTSFTTTIEMARSWWGDHNHYKQYLADKIGQYILDCLAEIEGGSDSYNQANDPHIGEQ